MDLLLPNSCNEVCVRCVMSFVISVCVVCRYSALSSAAGLDVSEARNRSIGRSSGAAGVREYQGRLSGPVGRRSLTPRSSQEKNFDTPVMTTAARYTPPRTETTYRHRETTHRDTLLDDTHR